MYYDIAQRIMFTHCSIYVIVKIWKEAHSGKDKTVATTPISASDFLSTLGVNVHLEQGTADYGNLSDVIADLNYLGISQVRDDITGGPLLPAVSYAQLAAAGVKFDFISDCGATETSASIASIVATIAAINAANPGSVIAVEGPNEINNFPTTFNGVGGTVGAVALQEALYSDVHSNANLAGAAVYYFTGYGYGGEAVGPSPATTAGLAGFDNQHIYPTGSTPSEWANPANQFSFFNESAPFGPGVYAEVGYSSNSVSETVQAQHTIDFFLDSAGYGVAQTYLYELMEEGDGYGLFNGTTPKPVATAIHNLTTILDDNGAGGVAPTPLNDTITGLPSSGHSMVIEKSTGVFDIALWKEGSGVSGVNVNLGATYASVDVADVITGAVHAYSNVSSVSLNLSQDPYIVEISGQATSGGGGTGTGTGSTSGGGHHHSHFS
jgi:hypothetical protein